MLQIEREHQDNEVSVVPPGAVNQPKKNSRPRSIDCRPQLYLCVRSLRVNLYTLNRHNLLLFLHIRKQVYQGIAISRMTQIPPLQLSRWPGGSGKITWARGPGRLPSPEKPEKLIMVA